MRISDAVIVDRDFRLYQRAKSLARRIEARMEYHRRQHWKLFSAAHQRRAQTILDVLYNDPNWVERTREIITLTSSCIERNETELVNVKAVMQHLFGDLPEPEPLQRSDYMQQLLETLESQARNSRAAQYKFLITSEIAYRTKLNAYLVFNTLTVEDGSYKKVFSKDSTVFKNYIASVNKRVKDHTYFAVVEEGAQHGRMHIHCLHLMSTLPEGTKDPNLGRIHPNHTQLETFRRLWKHGYSTPIAVRYSPNDAYGKLGWRWPLDPKTQQPLTIGSPLRLSFYLSKYISKSYQSQRRSELLWRIRKTQRFGQKLMTLLTGSLSRQTLIVIATMRPPQIKWMNQAVPQLTLRIAALRELQKRNQNSPDLTKASIQSTVTTLGKLSAPRQPIVQSPRALTRAIQTNNQQSITYLQTLDISDTDISNAFNELRKASHQIQREFFQEPRLTYGTTSTRDHIY